MRQRRWRNFTPYDFDEAFRTSKDREQYIEAFTTWIEERVSEGWLPYLMVFQFEQIHGRTKTVLTIMQQEIKAFYSKLILKVQKYPHTRKGSQSVPILLAYPEYPRRKGEKPTVAQVTINDGLHYHGTMLIPPRNYLSCELSAHIGKDIERYMDDSRLQSLYANRMNRTVARATGYGLKGLRSTQLLYDDSILILPRSRSEISKRDRLNRHLSDERFAKLVSEDTAILFEKRRLKTG